MSKKIKGMSLFLATALALTACSNDESTSDKDREEATEQNEVVESEVEQAEEEKVEEVVEEKQVPKDETYHHLLRVVDVQEDGELNSVNDSARDALVKHADVFINHTDVESQAIHLGKLKKDPSVYGEQFVHGGGNVVEADETEIDGTPLSYFQVYDYETGTVYQVFINGSHDIYEDDHVYFNGIVGGVNIGESRDGTTRDFPVIYANRLFKQ